MRRMMVFVGVLVLVMAGARGVEGAEAPRGLVEGNTAFALGLYEQVRQEPGNVFFSPYSISSALAMTYAGARGETAEEMARVLRFGADPEALHGGFAALNRSLFGPPGREDRRRYEIYLANALWGQRDFGFIPDYIALLEREYAAELHEVDYVADPEGARQRINQWAEERTRERIRDLIPQGMLDEDTRLVLTNAIYFKGNWAHKFDAAQTEEAEFHATRGPARTVQMMRQKQQLEYFQDEEVQVVQMPYAGGELAMAVILPRERERGRGGLEEVERNLTPQKLAGWMGGLRHREVEVFLPRFEMTAELELKEVLSRMGMRSAFAPGAADFTGITTDRRLFVSDVVHKAFVSVDEEGTEAAAATGVVMGLTAAIERPVFRADHPFLFIIRDVGTGSILFMGRVAEPGA